MNRMQTLRPEHHAEWLTVLGQSAQYDFYHLPQYHALAEKQGEGSAHLFVYREDGYSIALPLLLRSVETVPGADQVGTAWKDATSVYGYPGPVASHADVPEGVVRNFQAALRERLQSLDVVAVFSRLHPLLPQRSLLAGLGECKALAQTVSLDLTLPLDQQRSQFRKNHKEGVNRLRRAGVTCRPDPDRTYLGDFIRIYHETMHRVEAAESYFFSPAYFEELFSRLKSQINLFVCLQEGRVICGGLFIECDGILQYHLGGTPTEFLKLAPMKLMVDEVRRWGTEQGLRTLHLGGGATPRPDDSLLHFKMGFSNRQHEFSIWRWVLVPDVYHQLCTGKSLWNERHGVRSALPEYFPEYRCPTVPAL